jgi:biopolymer transport protein TolQ
VRDGRDHSCLSRRLARGPECALNVNADLSFLSLVTNASVVVQAILALLLLVSFLSWTSIFSKAFSLGRARRATAAFEEEFWNGSDITTLYQKISTEQLPKETMERIFEAGFREFLKYRKLHGTDVSVVMESARRAMRATFQRDLDHLESGLNFLATTGSVSPYVGLLGTVWGIMNAFRGLSNVGQATLAHVAPGIAEALVATAMGLFAAIPAVVAYNRFTHDVDRLANRFETFIEEFSNILQRQIPVQPSR